MKASRALRDARRKAGLTQRELAEKSGVAQSAIARIESGRVVPRVDTLDKLLASCGWGLESWPRPGIGVDRSLAWESLRRTPAQRLARAQQSAASMHDLVSKAKWV